MNNRDDDESRIIWDCSGQNLILIILLKYGKICEFKSEFSDDHDHGSVLCICMWACACITEPYMCVVYALRA